MQTSALHMLRYNPAHPAIMAPEWELKRFSRDRVTWVWLKLEHSIHRLTPKAQYSMKPAGASHLLPQSCHITVWAKQYNFARKATGLEDVKAEVD